MGVAVLILELIVLIAICGLVMKIFISFKRTPWYAIASTWLGWVLCFGIVLLLPIDIVDGDHQTCLKDHNNQESMCPEPIAYLPDDFMRAQWSALYWGTLIMSWLGFPILQDYSRAGDFTPWEKFVRAVKENVYLYLGMGMVGIICLIVFAATGEMAKKQNDQWLNLVMAVANAYGLILVMVLMGYGLVDIPRYLFRKASRERTLAHYHAQASKLKDSVDTAREELGKTLRDVKTVDERVKEHDPYRTFVDTILQKCPIEYDDVSGDGESGEIPYSRLVTLNKRMKEDTHGVVRAVCLYEMLLEKAFAIEDIIKLKENNGNPAHKIPYSFKQPRKFKYAYIVDTLEYYWELYFHTAAYYAMAVVASIFSIVIVWCEITMVGGPKLSPFAQIISHSDLQGFGKQAYCFIPLAYMALCAYTTLFKIKLFNYYRLVPHQQSDPFSIMFSANYLCRLAAPLSYNFTRLFGIQDGAFEAVMGEMDAFPGLGKDFTIFFPIFVGLFCLFSLLNAWSKLASLCCIKRFRYIPDDDYKLVTEGEKILSEERAVKEGRGPSNKTFKENLRSQIKSATRKILGGKDEETGTTPAGPPAPQAELTAAQKLRGKYSKVDGADLLPSTSKFSSMPPASAPPSSSIPSAPPAPSFSQNNNNSYASKSRATYDDLLPPTSRFSRNTAIVDIIHEEPAAAKAFTSSTPANNSSSAAPKSRFSSIFGTSKPGGKNDEVGLLPRGFAKSDSTIV